MTERVKNKLQDELTVILNEFVKICKKNNLKYFLVGGTLLGAVRHKGFIPWDDDIDIGMPREDYEKFVKECYKDMSNDYFLDYWTVNRNYWLPFAKVKMKNTIYKERYVTKDMDVNCLWIDVFPIDYTVNDKKSHLASRKERIKLISSILYNKNAKVSSDFKPIFKKIIYYLLQLVPNKLLCRYRNRIMCKENSKKCEYYINFGSQYSVIKQTHLIEKYYPLKKSQFKEYNFFVPNDYDYVLTKVFGNDYMTLPPVEKRVTHNPLKIKFRDGEEIIFDEKI